jgi:DNA adenine methylase
MKPPFSYYGGKQTLAEDIVKVLPEHTSYCEPFVGGAAVFWAKNKSIIEIINDTNKSLINFYRCLQNEYLELEKMVRITLHSRKAHYEAKIIYDNPDMFPPIKQAWAVWVLANQSFSSMLDGSWGYDKNNKASTSIKIRNKRDAFSEDLAIRLQDVQIECADALYIIQSRDTVDTLFYIDPPYYNSNCGHYDGYTEMDFEALLKMLQSIKGQFVLSSYPSELLSKYTRLNEWNQISLEQQVSVNKGKGKKKVEVVTTNYEFDRSVLKLDWK